MTTSLLELFIASKNYATKVLLYKCIGDIGWVCVCVGVGWSGMQHYARLGGGVDNSANTPFRLNIMPLTIIKAKSGLVACPIKILLTPFPSDSF